MTITHEVQFVDFDPQAGVLAGEAAPQDIVPTAEAIGAMAIPTTGLYFAAQEPKPSSIARQQLNTDEGRAEAERRRRLAENQDARRDAQTDQGSR